MPTAALSESQAQALLFWVVAARSWSETSQALVSEASVLTMLSLEVADVLEEDDPAEVPSGILAEADRIRLAGDLRVLAAQIEDQTAELRDRYLATAADIESYRSILG